MYVCDRAFCLKMFSVCSLFHIYYCNSVNTSFNVLGSTFYKTTKPVCLTSRGSIICSIIKVYKHANNNFPFWDFLKNKTQWAADFVLKLLSHSSFALLYVTVNSHQMYSAGFLQDRIQPHTSAVYLMCCHSWSSSNVCYAFKRSNFRFM